MNEQEVIADKNGQTELFQQEARRRNLKADIPTNFNTAAHRLKAVGHFAKFFKTFADYMANVNVNHDRGAALGNIAVALEQANGLTEALRESERCINKAIEMEGLLDTIEQTMGIPFEERYTNLIQDHGDPGDEDDAEVFKDSEESEEEEEESMPGSDPANLDVPVEAA